MKSPLSIIAALAASAVFLLAADLPNPTLTPGAINPAVTAETVRSTKWGKDARHVSTALKKRVCAAYGVPWEEHSKYEIDHLISRELGGADAASNLWPQHWKSPWGAREKDRLENRLHALICANAITLAEAQTAIAENWIAAFKKYIPAAPKPPAFRTSQTLRPLEDPERPSYLRPLYYLGNTIDPRAILETP
jgi:hypothetical protein